MPKFRYKYDGVWKTVKEPGIETVRWIENGVDGVDHTPITVEVKPGQTLYLPAGWFHQVHQTDQTIAVNYWYDRAYDQNFTKETFIDKVAEILHES